jgi:hypothetical protein
MRFSLLLVWKSAIFWGVTPYSLIVAYRRFEETYCLYLQGLKVSQARNQQADRSLPVHSTLPLGPAETQMNALQTYSLLSKIRFNIILWCTRRSFKRSHLCRFSDQNFVRVSHIRATFPAYYILHLTNLIFKIIYCNIPSTLMTTVPGKFTRRRVPGNGSQAETRLPVNLEGILVISARLLQEVLLIKCKRLVDCT